MNEARELWHTVEENEDIPIIAASYGIKDWKLVYEDSQNKKLREERSNPFILYKGDKVWIPEVESKQFSFKDRKRNTITLYPPKSVFQLCLKDDNGKPYKNIRYEIWINKKKVGDEEKRTREDGLVFESIPLCKEVELRVWFPVPKKKKLVDDDENENDDSSAERNENLLEEEEISLAEEELEEDPETFEKFVFGVARLNPLNTIEGLQDRLNNLGYNCGEEYGEIGDLTKQAIREFQVNNGLIETGEVDFNNWKDDDTLKTIKDLLKEE